jgi:endonuclease/exonuclease/phosphatase (EEP) superfamily protein YafD
VSVVLLAYAYPIALVVTLLLLLYVGESWWVTTLVLYLPRLGFLLPLPFIVLGLLVFRKFLLLLTQLGALVIVLFPMMGLVLPGSPERSGNPVFRVMTFNANSGVATYPAIARAIEKISPDIVFVQEAEFNWPELAAELEKHYPHVNASTQFLVGSRFPIVASTPPPRLPYWGRMRSPRFMRYRIQAPGGELAFYSVHPASPRGVLNLHRFRGAFRMLRSGELFAGAPGEGVGTNTGLRALQVEAIARLASKESVPVVIAGDTNLPTLSALYRKHLARYKDAFREAGSGFGYTFPAKYPWMRLDRVLASEEVDFVGFQLGCAGLSDHLCIYADMQRR